MRNERGSILLFTFILMAALTTFVSTLTFMGTKETRLVRSQIDDYQLLNLADAGVQRVLRVLRDDVYPASQTGTADLRGDDTGESISVGSPNNMIYVENGNATINNAADRAILKTFDTNYTFTRIVSVWLGVIADRASGGAGTTIQVSYTTTGSFPEVGNTILSQALTTALTTYTQNITADRTWTWATIMSPNFKLQALRTPASDRQVNIDMLFLRVVYEIDTNTEPWFTYGQTGFPINLGSGKIQSISVADEQGKVHLNTASQALLRYLMAEHGVAAATANTVATNIVNYRNTNNFDTIEEVQQVTGMTAAIYNAIKPDITVYSSINTYAQGPAGARAPININTASPEVLRAIFDPLTFSSGTDTGNLVNAIITRRATAPFTCFYTSDGTITTAFYDFERSQGYLSNAEDDRVLGNADASVLVPRSGGTDQNALTTEFCYNSPAVKAESLSDIAGRRYRVKTILGRDGSHTFMTFNGDTYSMGYRKENFE